MDIHRNPMSTMGQNDREKNTSRSIQTRTDPNPIQFWFTASISKDKIHRANLLSFIHNIFHNKIIFYLVNMYVVLPNFPIKKKENSLPLGYYHHQRLSCCPIQRTGNFQGQKGWPEHKKSIYEIFQSLPCRILEFSWWLDASGPMITWIRNSSRQLLRLSNDFMTFTSCTRTQQSAPR